MKIKKIKFENHPVLGDLELDFTDHEGNVIDTIILAGENGTGKSLILNSIFDAATFNFQEIRNEKRNFIYELSNKESEKLIEFVRLYNNIEIKGIQDGILFVNIDYSINTWERIDCIFYDYESNVVKIPGHLTSNNEIRQLFSTLFSDVDINFTPNEISTITSRSIDNVQSSERTNSNLATDITQLLVDIQSQDALELSEWAKKSIGIPVDENKIDVRIKRFSNAFEFMFPSKKYNSVVTVNGRKEVLFEENNRMMNIRQLSSGEKQVVFRGSFLLKNKKSTEGALILIDEPELSMHPKWQMRVLSFYKMLFTNESGKQSSQIVVATHSPFIIHNSSRNNDKVIVLVTDERGKITVSQHPEFYSWSEEIAVKEAFKIAYLLRDHLKTVFVEGETDEKYYKKAMEIYGIDSTKIDFQWIGRITKNGSKENSGDTALNHAFSFFSANRNMIIGEIVLLYDPETKKPETCIGQLKVRTMERNEMNDLFKVGIENLLTLPVDFDKSLYYKINVKCDNYGAESTIQELDKTKLCNEVCDNWSADRQIAILNNLKLEIERILMPVTVAAEQLN